MSDKRELTFYCSREHYEYLKKIFEEECTCNKLKQFVKKLKND